MANGAAEDIPTRLGRFEIESLLGRGAMGVVYKAHDPHIERTVAIKLIRADLLDGESRERYLARFRNEARVAGRCIHPNIISLYDFALHEGSPYLVMEYVDGADLRRAFPRSAPVAEPIVSQIALQVLDALDYAHGFGIIHRDIKPANILLTQDGKLKVTDFGISRFAFESTQSAVMVGTPSYMSPEQCRGVEIDSRCDLFSLGCVLYELSSGERAFSGESYAETLYRLINEPHIPLVERNPEISRDFSDLVDRALAKRPGDRFETARAMAAALRGLGRVALPAPGSAAALEDEPGTVIVTPASPLDLPATPTLSSSRSGSGSLVGSIDAGSLGTLERQLASHLGPIAGYHLRRALRDAQSTGEFHQMVSALVPEDSPERARIVEALALITMPEAPPPAPEVVEIVQAAAPEPEPVVEAITDDFAEKVTRALAEIIGPIAPRLVARARRRVTTRDDLVAACAESIDQPGERDQFLGRAAQIG